MSKNLVVSKKIVDPINNFEKQVCSLDLDTVSLKKSVARISKDNLKQQNLAVGVLTVGAFFAWMLLMMGFVFPFFVINLFVVGFWSTMYLKEAKTAKQNKSLQNNPTRKLAQFLLLANNLPQYRVKTKHSENGVVSVALLLEYTDAYDKNRRLLKWNKNTQTVEPKSAKAGGTKTSVLKTKNFKSHEIEQALEWTLCVKDECEEKNIEERKKMVEQVQEELQAMHLQRTLTALVKD